MRRQKAWVYVEVLKRKWLIKNFMKKILLKSLNNKKLSLINQEVKNFKKSKMPFFSIKTRFCNKCLVSGRNHNVFNKVKLSRFFLRNSLKKKNLSKIRKF